MLPLYFSEIFIDWSFEASQQNELFVRLGASPPNSNKS